MYPFSTEYQLGDNAFFEAISVLAALFIVITWFRNHEHIHIVKRMLVGLVGGAASYFVVTLFFGISQSFYTNIKDNINPDKQPATVTEYKLHVIKVGSRRTTHLKPLLKYKDEHGAVKQQYGDVNFSGENKIPVGTEVKVIVEDNNIRMVHPLKNFAMVANVALLAFLAIFYYVFYRLAKTGNLDGVENVLAPVSIYLLFPVAFSILSYITLSTGYDYFVLHKETVSRNAAIFNTGLGFFLVLCFFGYIKAFLEPSGKKKKKTKKKKKDRTVENNSMN